MPSIVPPLPSPTAFSTSLSPTSFTGSSTSNWSAGSSLPSSSPSSSSSTTSTLPAPLIIPFTYTNAQTHRRNSIVLLYPHDYLDTTLDLWTSGYRPYAWILGSLGGAFLSLYVCVFSKSHPCSGNWVLDAIQQDHFFCYLVPLLVPVVSFHVAWNWLGLKLFQQN